MAWAERQDAEKAAKIVNEAKEIVGRTRLQKIAYLLEISGLGDGFNFDYHHYGPYSEQLTHAIATAVSVGLICEAEGTASWGGSYSIFRPKAGPGSTTSGPRGRLIAEAKDADAIALELASTAAFLASECNPDPWTETKRRKPDKAKWIEDAKSLYGKLRAIPTPVPLPSIE